METIPRVHNTAIEHLNTLFAFIILLFLSLLKIGFTACLQTLEAT